VCVQENIVDCDNLVNIGIRKLFHDGFREDTMATVFFVDICHSIQDDMRP